jgi:hypothetical protein
MVMSCIKEKLVVESAPYFMGYFAVILAIAITTME